MDSEEHYRITWLIRRAFRGMGRAAGEQLEAFGISAADRAVMEFLYSNKAMSVPEIAARYDVSRQHIQVTVNALVDAALAERRPNPRHRRSPLIALTPAGRRLFERIRKRDLEFVDKLFDGLPEAQLRATLETLETLNEKLAKGDHQ